MGDRRRSSSWTSPTRQPARHRSRRRPSTTCSPDCSPDDTVPDELVGYRFPRHVRSPASPYRQLDYWARTNLVSRRFAGPAGSGSQRLVLLQDILVLKIVKRLLDTGISLQTSVSRWTTCASAVSAIWRASPSSPTAPPSTSARLRRSRRPCCRVVRACSGSRSVARCGELTGNDRRSRPSARTVARPPRAPRTSWRRAEEPRRTQDRLGDHRRSAVR